MKINRSANSFNLTIQRDVLWLLGVTVLAAVELLNVVYADSDEPSFQCSKATTLVEKRICQSPYQMLKPVDRALAEEYRKALKLAPHPKKLIVEQREWLKTLPSCFTDKQVPVPQFVCSDNVLKEKEVNISLEQRRQQCSRDVCLANRYFERTKVLKDFQESLMPPFRLEKDTGWNVCHDYLKSLEILNPKPEFLACDINIAPNMPQFSLPEWQELDIEENWEIVYRIENELKLDHPKIPPSMNSWRDSYRERIRKGEIKPRLRQAKMRFSSEEPEEIFYGYTRDLNNTATCIQSLQRYPGLDSDTGDTIYYRESLSNKLLPVFPDTDANFSGNSESRVILHKSMLYLINAGQKLIIISRIFTTKAFGTKDNRERHFYGQNICKIISRLIPTT